MKKQLIDTLRMFYAVKEICNQYESTWSNDTEFVEAYYEFQEHTSSLDFCPEYDIPQNLVEKILDKINFERASSILNYQLDREIFKFKNVNREFYQAYFRARIFVKYGFDNNSDVKNSGNQHAKYLSKSA